MPRYTIAIPTLDRPEILRSTLAAALSLPRTDLEILVSDNFSDPRTADVLRCFSDPRLRKVRTSRRLPMPDHWEWIWSKVRGDYVIYTGDDSAVTAKGLEAADKAIDLYSAKIISWRCATYYHPDWNVRFRHLPSRGNIIGVDPGFTNSFYEVNPTAVITHFTNNLRLSGCFPSVVNLLVKKTHGDEVIKATGRFHWAPCPDISASLLAMTSVEKDKFIYWDGLGAIGGRSGQSNVASMLSRGKASGRLREYLDEFSDHSTRFPIHNTHLESITNLLAAAVSLTKHYYPNLYPDIEINKRTLIERSIDDAFSDLTVPWADDPEFINQLDSLIMELEPTIQTEVKEYMGQAIKLMRNQLAEVEYHFNPTPASSHRGFLSTAKSLLENQDGRARKIFLKTFKDPTDQHWSYAGTNFVDMKLFDGRGIHDAIAMAPTIEELFGTGEFTFASSYLENGMLHQKLPT